jgi:hypothetical protein
MRPEVRMLHALAGHLKKFVWEVVRDCPADEWLDWMRLQGVEPWGGARLDALFAMAQSTMAAPYCKQPIPPASFLPRWGENRSEPLTEEERQKKFSASLSQFLIWAKAHAKPG